MIKHKSKEGHHEEGEEVEEDEEKDIKDLRQEDPNEIGKEKIRFIHIYFKNNNQTSLSFLPPLLMN